MPTKTESIKAFLMRHTHPDLAMLYNPAMEVQVNVAADGGERVTGEFKGKQWSAWTDGIQTWKNFRIPRNANSAPEYTDTQTAFNFEDHVEAIGMTGWNWGLKVSQWVAFDFDDISGHSEKHQRKMEESEVDAVRKAATEIDWITVRRSTGGKGVHLYVFFEEPVPTSNHNEHAALARAILGSMSAATGFDFEARVDVCGHNMWCWHRKMFKPDVPWLKSDPGTFGPETGLTLLKQGSPLFKVPPHWRDHIKVITGHRKRNLPHFIEQVENGSSEAEQRFTELTGQTSRIPLDEDHKKLLKWLAERKTMSWWDTDHHLLVSHTFHLKEAHQTLGLKGVFDTISQGTERGADYNCYLLPLKHGGWSVRRYTLGVREHELWEQDGKGWTRCFFNVDPTLAIAARMNGGLEDPTGGFVFSESEIAAEAAVQLGASVPNIPLPLKNKKAKLRPHKDGRIIMEIEGDNNVVAVQDMAGWLYKKGKWIKLFPIKDNVIAEPETNNYDDFIRHVITQSDEDAGWSIKSENDVWRSEPLTHIQKALESMHISQSEVKVILGTCVLHCWQLINQPFHPEYPGSRKWNKGAAQFRYVPSPQDDLQHPHWDLILKHIGSGINNAIETNPWCKIHGIIDGAHYLRLWIASLFREPMEPLPYLFLYGSQNAGKSILHEALSLLMTGGYKRADVALVNPQGFNEELSNAVLCVVEEINLQKDKNASNRIKDWVTARQLPIHPKGRTPYHIRNATHWIQVANPMTYCPAFPGDTRITMINVPDLLPSEIIPKNKILIPALEKEAPDFMASIMRIELPPSNDRLNVPVIATSDKAEAERMNQTPVESFLSDRCYPVVGKMIRYGELYERFMEWAEPAEVARYTKIRFGREIPSHFPRGRLNTDNQMYVGNISFEPYNPGDPVLPKLVAVLDPKGIQTLVAGNGNGDIKRHP